MEVGRLSVKYGIDPPALIAMEQEIMDSESHQSNQSDDPMKVSDGTLVNSQSDNQCGSRNSFGSEISDENKENPRDDTPLPVMMQIPMLSGLGSNLKKATSELGVQTDLSDSVDSGLLVDDDQNNHECDEEPNSELDVKVFG